MPKTNWKKLINPDYLGAYSLDSGDGKYSDIVVTIKSIKIENVTGPDGKKENCAVAYFVEPSVKPMILNVTNMKTLEKLFSSKYIEDWSGKKIQIGVEKVKAFGDVVDALRVRKFIPRPANNGAPVCADCDQNIKSFDKYSPEAMAEYTTKKYDRPLCADCAKKAQEQQQKVVDPLGAERHEQATTPESEAVE